LTFFLAHFHHLNFLNTLGYLKITYLQISAKVPSFYLKKESDKPLSNIDGEVVFNIEPKKGMSRDTEPQCFVFNVEFMFRHLNTPYTTIHHPQTIERAITV